MKKQKISWLLNIATICLAVCAIAIGVYSAKTASLNIGGSISFVAHNIKADVSLFVKGDAVKPTTNNEETTYSPDPTGIISRPNYEQLGNTLSIDNTNQGETHKIYWSSPIYFCDATSDVEDVCDIYLKVSVINNSDFPIKASFAEDTANKIDGVTTSIAENSSSYVKIAKQGQEEIILKLSVTLVDDIYQNITSADNVNLSMTLEKYEEFYTKEIIENIYNTATSAIETARTTTRLCTQIGHGTGADNAEFTQLEWYAFAVKGVDTGNGYVYNNTWYLNSSTTGNKEERWYSLTGINFNENLEMVGIPDTDKSAKGKTFWFIQEYTVSSKQFNSAKDSAHETSYGSYTQYADTETEGKIYESDIYKYINGTGDSDYLAQTGIKYDTTNIKVKERKVNERNYTGNSSGGFIGNQITLQVNTG